MDSVEDRSKALRSAFTRTCHDEMMRLAEALARAGSMLGIDDVSSIQIPLLTGVSVMIDGLFFRGKEMASMGDAEAARLQTESMAKILEAVFRKHYPDSKVAIAFGTSSEK